ncbi:MAG: xanthine permease [Firmicutes bacterium]|jgi:uracil permease|nr:xanthine permease [Bacillota bacterium]MDH7496633.1 solute carrier family 23 protein [Bacillota bacterium]
MSTQANTQIVGYLPDDTPPAWRLVFFALQQVVVMFPATVLVALLTGFHVSTTLFASGLATLGFILVTRGRIPLYYGSSFSYIAAVAAITGVKALGTVAPDALISQAQCGIIASGLVSILAGTVINRFGRDKVEKVLPPVVTGSVAMVIGIALADEAMSGTASNWTVGIVTLLATILFSVYLRGTLGQLPVLLGVAVGYVVSIPLGLVDFAKIGEAAAVTAPHFTFPSWSPAAILAIMPIAIATIPESTAHLYQIDLYVNNLARQLGRKKTYPIASLLGTNLIGDGIGDIIAGAIGGPAGTNYGENNSVMAITRNFSVPVLVLAAAIAMGLSFFGKLAAAVSSVPGAVIGGVSIYLFGVIGVQGVALMISERVDLFSARTLAVAATVLVIGIGGSFAFPNGMIPAFGMNLPAIATAAIFGIVLNLVFEFFPVRVGPARDQAAQARS